MKEIGGYIELEHFHGEEYYLNAIRLNCGRNCLAYLIEAYSITKIYIPYFLCSSVADVCKKYSVEVKFYRIDNFFQPIIPDSFNEGDYFYLVNYYGQISKEKILEIKEKVGNLIVDNAQAFFESPVDDIPTIYTCRKYFGVADGAYLFSKKKLSRELELDYSYDRMHFLLGRFEKSANEFYYEYSVNNHRFTTEPIKIMSRLTNNILKAIDYDYICNRRTENFKFLNVALKDKNGLQIKDIKGAFAYPLLLENGADIRKELQQKKIYIPTLWPDVFDLCDESMLEFKYAKNILPIPVDQRYSIEDMNLLVSFLSEL